MRGGTISRDLVKGVPSTIGGSNDRLFCTGSQAEEDDCK